RVAREQLRPVRVLEAARPVRKPEMAEVHDGRDVEPAHLSEHLIGELPVVALRRRVDTIIWRAVAQVAQPELSHQRQVGLPVPVVERLLQLVHARAATVGTGDRGTAALDPGGEDEVRWETGEAGAG